MARTPSSIARGLTAMVLAPLLAAGLLVAATAAPASAAAGVTVQGTITGETSPGVYAPANEVSVSLLPLVGDGTQFFGTNSSADGTYTVNGVPPGRYRVRFHIHTTANAALAETWLGNTPYEAQSEILEVGTDPVTGVNAQLEIGSTLSGQINFADGVEPEAAASAFLFDFTTGEYERTGFRAVADASGRYTIRGLPAGTYTLRFGDVYDQALVSTVYWEDSEFIFSSTPVEIAADVALDGFDATVGEGGVWVSRIAGADRFDTAVQISRVGYPGNNDAVFIVNGLNFPDALGAGPAAARADAPILLVTPWGIPDSVRARLHELAPSTVYIVGGTPSVSAAVEAELAAGGPGYTSEVVRFSGADRFETSRMVADYFWGGDDVEANRTAYIATGLNFPDALSAAPAAANEYAPVILVNGGAGSLDAPTASLLEDLGIEKVVVAGGEPSVSAGVKSSLDALPFIVESYRRKGVDRFDTSVITNRNSFPLADAAFLATGSTFPDALAGAALAGSWFAPVYLVRQNCIPEAVLSEIGRLHVRDVILLGGEPTLSDDVMQLAGC